MADKMSESEKQYYDALVAETAKEVVRPAGGKGESAEQVIERILKREQLFEEGAARFSRDVMKKADELKAKARDKREQMIILKYEGEIRNAEGKLRPAGIQENFKVRVRAGNLYRRIVGTGVDADELNKLLHEVQDIEDRMEQNKVELAQLKAAREATSTIIGSEKLGLTVGVTKASVVKHIYQAKMRAQGWTSLFSGESNLWQSYKAAHELKERHEAEYRTEGKTRIKELEKEAKELDTKKQILEAALKRVEEMRADGRAIFESTFGNELNVLVEGRETLGETEFVKRIADMRTKAERFGKESGFVGMDFFLREDLTRQGIKLAMFGKPGEYAEPQTEVEKGRERVRLSRWFEKVFLKKPSEEDISGLIGKLRESDDGFLKIFTDRDFNENEFPGNSINWTLRFLLTGRNADGKEILEAGRRSALNADNIVKNLVVARKAAAKAGDDGALKLLLERFALERSDKADDFGYSIDQLLKTGKTVETAKERLERLNPLWERLTGSKLENAGAADGLFEALRKRYGAETAIAVEQLNNLSREKSEFIRFFFTGKLGPQTFDGMNGLLCPADDFDGCAGLLSQVLKFFADEKPNAAELKLLCERLRKKARGEKDESTGERSSTPLPQLTAGNEKYLVEQLAKVRKPTKKKEKKVVAAAKPAAKSKAAETTLN